MLKKRSLFFCFNLITIFLFCQNQEYNYDNLKFKNISVNEGLSQSTVLCILQDNKGFLWFGTRAGLNKYDGNTFTIYNYNFNDDSSLSNGFVKALFQDKNETLWIGTKNGLNWFNTESNKFAKVTLLNAKKSNLFNEVSSFANDDNQHLWVGTNNGLGRLDVSEKKIKIIHHVKSDNNSLSNNNIKALLKTSEDALWISTNTGIDLYNQKEQNFKHYNYPKGFNLSPEEPITFYESKKKEIWLGLPNGLAFFNKATDSFEFLKNKNNQNVITEKVRSICEDDFENMWIGTYRGLYVFDLNKKKIFHNVHDSNIPSSLSHNSIYSLLKDNKGDIWAGTFYGGLNYYDGSFNVFERFIYGVNNLKLNYNVVSSIEEDSSKNLWIGTEGGGINIYNHNSQSFSYYTHNPNDPKSLSSNNVQSILKDRNGDFWIGTHGGGLNYVNHNKLPYEFKKYNNSFDNTKNAGSKKIISLLEDSKGRIWIGTGESGLFILDKLTDKISPIENSLGLLGTKIYSISKTLDKNVILVGHNKGLAKIYIDTHEIIPVNFKDQNSNALATGVFCTYTDKDNNIWIGTDGDGLYYYNEGLDKIDRYCLSKDFYSDFIYGIVPDDIGNMWISTNLGLYQLNIEKKKIKRLDESDGLHGDEFNRNAYHKNKDGKLFFGGINGFCSFYPQRIIKNEFIPPVEIISFKVDGDELIKKFDKNNVIELRYNQNSFDFNFVALNYSQPNKNQYAYKLVGFDDDWNYIGNKRDTKYTNLIAGTYTFKVKASNNDGLWNNKGKELTIIIQPAPWRTWWAYLLYSCVFIVLGFLLRRNTLKRIQDKNELKFERVDKERIKEANTAKLEFFTNISHDFRTPLTLISGSLDSVLNEKESLNDTVKGLLKIMQKNTTVLMQLVNELLDFRKSESGKLQLNASKNNIVSFIESNKSAFEELSRNNLIIFTLRSSHKDIDVWFDINKLQRILFNLLYNAFKFTPKGGKITLSISLELSKKDTEIDYVKIKIENTGEGIPKEKIKFIFNRFYQSGNYAGTGIGLDLTKSLVELHQGKINVKSCENKTCFTLIFPLGKEHLRKDQLSDSISFTNEFYTMHNTISNELKIENNEQKVKPFDTSLSSILIVDDNTEIRNLVKRIFDKDYNVFEAENGNIALKSARNKDVDLIISDIMMPEMDGIEFCKIIKSEISTSHIPVILLTARNSSEYKESGYLTGADVYITKPFNSKVLRVRANNLLDSRKKLIEKFKKDALLQTNEVVSTSVDEQFLIKAKDIIEENFTNPEFTVESFIKEMNVSRAMLYRKMKILTGQSVKEFIRIMKLKRASQLLLKTDMRISEIAYNLGFNDLKYFRQLFKSQFNVTPSKFRKENKDSNQTS